MYVAARMVADAITRDDSTIAEAVLKALASRPRDPAVHAFVDGAWQAIRAGDLEQDVRALAGGLAHLGLQPGDRVGIVGSNSPAWGTAFLALLLAGCVAVPLDRLQTPSEWNDQLDRAGAETVFGAPTELTLLKEVSGTGTVRRHIWFDGPAQAPDLTTDQLRGLAGSFDTDSSRRRASDLAVIIFTSGTTGKSKGVMLSHRNILADAVAMLQVVGIGPADRFLSVLPISHAYECTCGFVAPLLAGASIHYARSLTPTEVVADLASSKATFLLSVPLLLEKLTAGIERGLKRQQTPQARAVHRLWQAVRALPGPWRRGTGRLVFGGLRRRAGLDRMRYMICGGAPLRAEVGRAIEALGIGFLQGYGLSETSPVATLNRPGGANPASVGRPLPGVEIRIVEPDATGSGEILIRGPVVAQGYWADPDATAASFADGWFRTGDRGRLNRRGDLFITGRSKNLIVTAGGKNISPEEIEGALLSSPFIAECIVFGAPRRDGGGEEVQALIHPDQEYFAEWCATKSAAEDPAQRLRVELDRLTAHLAPYKRIVQFKISPEPFRKTTSQKIKRHMYTEGQIADEA